MTKEERALFSELRETVADMIHHELEEDNCCKSYEGTWELLISFPNYFEDKTATAKPDYYQITLHCYVIGPSRHYTWHGKTWMEALTKCKHDIDEWNRWEYK